MTGSGGGPVCCPVGQQHDDGQHVAAQLGAQVVGRRLQRGGDVGLAQGLQRVDAPGHGQHVVGQRHVEPRRGTVADQPHAMESHVEQLGEDTSRLLGRAQRVAVHRARAVDDEHDVGADDPLGVRAVGLQAQRDRGRLAEHEAGRAGRLVSSHAAGARGGRRRGRRRAARRGCGQPAGRVGAHDPRRGLREPNAALAVHRDVLRGVGAAVGARGLPAREQRTGGRLVQLDGAVDQQRGQHRAGARQPAGGQAARPGQQPGAETALGAAVVPPSLDLTGHEVGGPQQAVRVSFDVGRP